jgi:hypothetical protein
MPNRIIDYSWSSLGKNWSLQEENIDVLKNFTEDPLRCSNHNVR